MANESGRHSIEGKRRLASGKGRLLGCARDDSRIGDDVDMVLEK
jgi:hypothetical protein